MTKETILEQLHAARAGHIGWVQRAKLLLSGFDVKEDAIPLDSTSCKFGQWFYSDGQKLRTLHESSPELWNRIEAYHIQIHDIYLNIFKIFYGTGKKGFFAKLLGSKKKVSDADRETAQGYLDDIRRVSKQLIHEIEQLEKEVLAIDGSRIAALQ